MYPLGRYHFYPKTGPFHDLHPSPTGGDQTFQGMDLPDAGGTKGNESRFVRCRWCGFICDLERDSLEDDLNELNGNKATETSYTISGVTHWYGNLSNVSGCPLCGSRNYL